VGLVFLAGEGADERATELGGGRGRGDGGENGSRGSLGEGGGEDQPREEATGDRAERRKEADGGNAGDERGRGFHRVLRQAGEVRASTLRAGLRRRRAG